MIKKLNMEFIEKLDNILYRCERVAISNDPPAIIIGLEVPPSMILENILFQVL